VWLSEQEEEGYYFGLANEGLWPLCHVVFVRPSFRETDWKEYRAVNARFAAAVVAEAKRSDPIVLVQDYHFALLPRMIRERLPEATIITFWHIPWPNAETFGICPWKEEIIAGLLGSSVLGFHTQFHCNNFIDTVDRFIESRIDREHASVTVSGHETFVRPYLMRDVVRSRNVYRWAGQMLLDAAQLRKRQKIMLMASQKPKNAFIQGHFGKLRKAR
jgi:trehalose 6-phosphate synthase